MGHHLGPPVVNGLVRNRDVGRTFSDGVNRQDSVRMKFTPLTDILEGKRIYLVDDTLVRGTTLKTVVTILKERGHAKEVHVRIGCPPVMAPCFYGIDMPTVSELFAPAYLNGKDGKPPNGRGQSVDPSPEALQKMADELGADSLGYLSQERLIKAVGLPPDQLCQACLDTRYPTPAGEARYQESLAAK